MKEERGRESKTIPSIASFANGPAMMAPPILSRRRIDDVEVVCFFGDDTATDADFDDSGNCVIKLVTVDLIDE